MITCKNPCAGYGFFGHKYIGGFVKCWGVLYWKILEDTASETS